MNKIEAERWFNREGDIDDQILADQAEAITNS